MKKNWIPALLLSLVFLWIMLFLILKRSSIFSIYRLFCHDHCLGQIQYLFFHTFEIYKNVVLALCSLELSWAIQRKFSHRSLHFAEDRGLTGALKWNIYLILLRSVFLVFIKLLCAWGIWIICNLDVLLGKAVTQQCFRRKGWELEAYRVYHSSWLGEKPS